MEECIYSNPNCQDVWSIIMQVDPHTDFAEELPIQLRSIATQKPLEEPQAKRLARGSFFQARISAPPEKRGPQKHQLFSVVP